MKKTVYICLLLLVLSCTSREKPYSCKLVELQDLNTFPAIDLPGRWLAFYAPLF